MYRRRPTSIQVDIVGTEGRDFELKFVFANDDDTKMSANSMGPREDFLHLFGPGVCHDINVLGYATADQIANTTAGEIGQMASIAQMRTNLARRFFHERCFHRSLNEPPGLSF